MGKCKGCEQEVKKLVKDRCIECYPVDIGSCESESRYFCAWCKGNEGIFNDNHLTFECKKCGKFSEVIPTQYMVYQLGFEYLFEDDKHD